MLHLRKEAMTRTQSLAVCSLLALALAAAEPTRQDSSAGAQAFTSAQAREIFEGRCVECHVPPDPLFETDRAWIDQVRRTA